MEKRVGERGVRSLHKGNHINDIYKSDVNYWINEAWQSTFPPFWKGGTSSAEKWSATCQEHSSTPTAVQFGILLITSHNNKTEYLSSMQNIWWLWDGWSCLVYRVFISRCGLQTRLAPWCNKWCSSEIHTMLLNTPQVAYYSQNFDNTLEGEGIWLWAGYIIYGQSAWPRGSWILCSKALHSQE